MEDIQLEAVESSNVSHIGYGPRTQTVRVKFKKTGATWDYWPVEANDYQQIRHAESIGSAVQKFLVKGPYSSRKVS